MDSSVPTTKKKINKGVWTPEEDTKLAEAIAANGPKRWNVISAKSGLDRCGKSCRLRWMNYLRPNIKRGNISDQEEDLILRLHKLLGNRWSLIAGRIPGRTDNEIKNYWNSHLSKKLMNPKKKENRSPPILSNDRKLTMELPTTQQRVHHEAKMGPVDGGEASNLSSFFDVDEFFDFSSQACSIFNWVAEVVSDDRRFKEFSSGFTDPECP